MSLAWLIALATLNHSAIIAMRIAASLQALALGASPLEVGVLVALFSILPAFLSVRMGRAADRGDVWRLMREGSIGLAAGSALPAVWPSMPTLLAGAVVIGLSFLRFQLAVQTATGQMGTAADRVRNFSHLSLGFSTSAFAGPLLAGVGIDTVGYRWAFALIMLLPLVALLILLRRGGSGAIPLRPPFPAPEGSFRALLLAPELRFVFVASALVSMAWDLHAFFVPIYGTQIGLSASESGAILSAFAAATFVIRFLLTRYAARVSERRIVQAALIVAAVVFFVYPFVTHALLLSLLAFLLGLGLGSGQPVVMSMIHAMAPDGRAGEVTGVRQAIINTTQVTVPLVFGALGTAAGLLPVFWAVGGALVTGSWFARVSPPAGPTPRA